MQLALREGMTVGDFGAGAGHYARALAHIVGREGKVYAIDIQEDLLKHLKSGVHPRHRGVVETVWGDIERAGGTRLKDSSLDAAVLANAFFQIENRFGLLKELLRVLKPGGKLLVVDWAGSYGGIGPAPERVVSERAAEEFFINGGMYKVKSFRAGPHHYGLVFAKP